MQASVWALRWSARAARAIWRSRLLRFTSASAAVVSGLALAGAGSYVASIDLPAEPGPPQASVLYYADGRTVLARVGVVNRNDVTLAQVPGHVRHAVLAAEDRNFYRHHGLSTRGIVRAAWSNVTGHARQGASTITQQYVRNAYLTQDRTIQRKVREAALAAKVEQRYSKDEILIRYLNTIYFGRGAYGIGAAAHAYFGSTVDTLTPAQGAVLAAVIKDPRGFDPAENPDPAHRRWRWVLSAVVDAGWLDQAMLATMRYPQLPTGSVDSRRLRGATGLIIDQVERELSRHGIPPQTLRTGGLHVVTTLDERMQRAAVDESERVLRNQPDNLRSAVVAVEPSTGAVRAYYGGDRGRGFFDDAAAARPPAATFKPIVLAEALRQDISVKSRWDGTSPQSFADRGGVPLYNPANAQCARCTLSQAMAQSLNTPFYALAEHVGPARVAQLAHELGVAPQYQHRPTLIDAPGEPAPGRTRADIAIGRYPVSPADLASVYATFAAGGLRVERHVVTLVRSTDGARLRTTQPAPRRVLTAAVAADITTVLATGTEPALPDDRPAVAQTGSQHWGDHGDNQDAWLAGYTPDLAAVVWIGRDEPGPIRDAAGRPVDGGTLPRDLWRGFMATSLAGCPVTPLPPPANVGRADPGTGAVAPFRPSGPTPLPTVGSQAPAPPNQARAENHSVAPSAAVSAESSTAPAPAPATDGSQPP